MTRPARRAREPVSYCEASGSDEEVPFARALDKHVQRQSTQYGRSSRGLKPALQQLSGSEDNQEDVDMDVEPADGEAAGAGPDANIRLAALDAETTWTPLHAAQRWQQHPTACSSRAVTQYESCPRAAAPHSSSCRTRLLCVMPCPSDPSVCSYSITELFPQRTCPQTVPRRCTCHSLCCACLACPVLLPPQPSLQQQQAPTVPRPAAAAAGGGGWRQPQQQEQHLLPPRQQPHEHVT
jgi:hypothetical protein